MDCNNHSGVRAVCARVCLFVPSQVDGYVQLAHEAMAGFADDITVEAAR